jgi:hypothetical protein
MNRGIPFIALAVAGCLFGCAKDEPQTATYSSGGSRPNAEGESAIPGFWSWFAENSQRLARDVDTAPERAIAEITYELQRIDSVLCVEIATGESPKVLFVSAEGIKSAFPFVEKTVAAAPTIKDWKVVAFRQPKPDVQQVEYKGVTLSREQVKFILLNDSRPPDVAFYIDGLQSEGDLLSQALFLLLDALIGEYNTSTHIGGIEFKSAGEAPAGAMTLNELPKALGLQ